MDVLCAVCYDYLPLFLLYLSRVNNQGRTKDEPKNSQTQKSTFIKIAILFPSLIPCLISPTEDRETTERRAKRYRALAAKNSALFLRLIPEKVDSHPKKVDSFPKSVALYSSPLHPILCTLHQKNYSKKRFFLHISKKKCIFAGIIATTMIA